MAQIEDPSITVAQLAQLARLCPDWFSLHRSQLPPASPRRAGANGRPPMCWTASQIAEWVAEQTKDLSETEVRLIAACRLQSYPTSKADQP